MKITFLPSQPQLCLTTELLLKPDFSHVLFVDCVQTHQSAKVQDDSRQTLTGHFFWLEGGDEASMTLGLESVSVPNMCG